MRYIIPPRSLHAELKSLDDKYQNELEDTEKLSDMIESCKHMLGDQEIHIEQPKPALEKQKKIMELYRNNPILNNAIADIQSIEDRLTELAQINKGIRKYLPRRKDSEYNREVEYMEELTGSSLAGLKSRGVFTPDHIFSTLPCNLIGSEAMILGIVYFMGKFDPSIDVSQRYENIIKYFAPGYAALITTITAGKFNIMTYKVWDRFYRLPFEQARFLDERIDEIYHGAK
jgi:hypothetical protein